MGIAIVTLIPTLAEIIVIYAVHFALAALGVAILSAASAYRTYWTNRICAGLYYYLDGDVC